jgi:hypothetical protein
MRISKQLFFMLSSMLLIAGKYSQAKAQSVSPMIAEYSRQADGYFEVTNSALAPQVVVLEPKSFDIQPDGTGVFRPLDPTIHLELSTKSLRLAPQQTARIFYKVKGDDLPAWFCIYAAFSAQKKAEGVNVRIMLPHTVYIYQREPLTRESIDILNVHFDKAAHSIECDVVNHSKMASRAQEIELSGKRSSRSEGGFPILPGATRKLSFDWTEESAPETIAIRFREFTVKRPITPVAE